VILTSAPRSRGEVRITEAERPRHVCPGRMGCQTGIAARSAARTDAALYSRYADNPESVLSLEMCLQRPVDIRVFMGWFSFARTRPVTGVSYVFVSRKVVLGLVAVVSGAACAFLILVLIRKGLAQAGLWSALLAALAGIVATTAAVWAVVPHAVKVPLPPKLEVPGWVVGRPAELAGVVKALLGGRPGTVGITTGLYGAGGFGKTTLALMVCADRQVRRRFGRRVYLITIGRDVRGAAAIAAKVNDVIKLVTGEDATYADPQLAGRRLGALLDAGPRRLLVLDDVWAPEQLAPFAEGGKRCRRLVTTRVPELLSGRGVAVPVDQMTSQQAQALLTSGLPELDSVVVQGLLGVTGRWPLLLRLVNKILADYARMAPDVSVQAAVLLGRLRAGGPTVVDEVLREADRGLDVGQPEQRARAVRTTIDASTSLLNRHDAERFAELGVFAKDETIPFCLVARLWGATADMDNLQAAQVCWRLAQLALISQSAGADPGISMHDVIRDFLRAQAGAQRLSELNNVLLNAAAAGLPAAALLVPAEGCPARVAWSELDRDDSYLWGHLIEHLIAAGCRGEADTIAADLRWVGARLEQFGPAAPAADLSAVGTPRAARLEAVLARTAHLLAPTEPPRAVIDVLHSRVAEDPDWGPQVAALRELCPKPRLVNRWPLPDVADPTLKRVLVGHHGRVTAVAMAPNGSWLASGSDDRTVRIWDVATGQQRAVLRGHRGKVKAVAVAPGGSWLASGSDDGTVRIWDVATGQERAVLKRGRSAPAMWMAAVAVAPDGTWLATGGGDSAVRIWDVATWQERSVLTGHDGWGVDAVAVAPDGSWLATGGGDGTARVWDVATGQDRAVIKTHWAVSTRHGGAMTAWSAVRAVAVAPDGSWLAAVSDDGTARIWDVATRQERSVLKGHRGEMRAVAVAPDGSWLATGGQDGTVRVWDMATGQERSVLGGHVGGVTAVAVAPDGNWLATSGGDRAVRIWDMASGRGRAAVKSHVGGVRAVAGAPDGSWLATGGRDGTVRIVDVATGQERSVLGGHDDWGVAAVAIAPDGSWLASLEAKLRIWDMATGREQAALSYGRIVRAMAAAVDGSWLAAGSENGMVRIWDLPSARERIAFKGHVGMVRAMAAVPGGSWLAVGGGVGIVRIWDVVKGRERVAFKGHRDVVEAVAAAPDGNWLAVGDRNGMVRIWDIATGQEQAVLKGHRGAVEAVAAAPDGSWLATGGQDGTVRIWDVATWRAQALMRVDNGVDMIAWIGAKALAVVGPAGLYLFDLLTDTDPALPGFIRDPGLEPRARDTPPTRR
jgi:WD40 repeat protein